MAMTIPAAMKSAILSGATYPVVLVQIDWPGGPIRVHSGVGPLTWDGETWTGVGALGFLQLPRAARGLGQEAGRLTFGGVPAAIEEILTADSADRRIDVWSGVLERRTPAPLLSDPVPEFRGVIDDAGDEIGPDGETRQAWLEFIAGPSQRSGGSPVHTYEDQQASDATDTAGRWVRAALANTIAEVPKW